MNTFSLFALSAVVSSTAFAGVSVTNDCAVMTFDGAGRVTSLVERASGRELLAAPATFCYTGDGKYVQPERMEARGADTFAWIFPAKDGGGEAVFKITSFGPGWTIEVLDCTVPTATDLYFGRLIPACTKHVGRIANMLSDDGHGVCLRGYRAKCRMAVGSDIRVNVEKRHGFTGTKAGLVAATRQDLVPALRKMTEAAGAFRTVNGGAWSLGSEANRGSYCFADLYSFAVEDWIDFALRGGFDTIHPNGWWKYRGHYEFQESAFPNGGKDWKEVCDRIHAAGLRVGMHTLTGAIQPRDSWATPECREELMDWCVHTLARPLGTNDTVMYVNEMPEKDFHHTFHSYSSRGNTFRIGTELITYTGMKYDPPYAFTGVKRGAWESKVTGVIPSGAKAHYLYQRYDAFYPDPESRLADELGAAIGRVRDLGDVDQIYLDGAEAVREDRDYANDRHRERILPHLKEKMLIEGSNSDAFTWWYLSRYGAWDRPYWGMKRMHDDHLVDVERARTRNLLEAQMGWWHPEIGNWQHPGHRLDDMEYFAARNTAVDTSMSTQGTGVSSAAPLQFSVMQQITLLGWYERFRMARVFSPAAMEILARPRQETKLRLNRYSGWQLSAVTALVHRVTGAYGTDKWDWKLSAAGAASLRVEALYHVDTASTNAVTLLSAADAKGMRQPYRVNHVELKVATAKDAEKGDTLRLSVRNGRGVVYGANCCVLKEWKDDPYKSAKGCYAFGLWVKGDGSGTDLWVALESAKLYHWGQSFHRITLDFTGWRQFTFPMRERDISEAHAFAWNEGLDPMVTCATPINMEHIGSVRLYFNNIPTDREVVAEVSEITAYPAVKKTVKGPALVVNGRETALPFPTMESGDYAELDEGRWHLYNECGQPKAVAHGSELGFGAGTNALAFKGVTTEGAPARAQVAALISGRTVAALLPREKMSEKQKKALEYEAMMPSAYCPAKGLVELEPIVIRPNEKARLETTIHGPVDRPVFRWCDEEYRFDVILKRNERLYCKDGLSWRVVDSRRRTLAEGKLAKPLPVLMAGRTTFGVTSADDKNADARIDFVKHYTGEASYFESHEIKVKSSIDGTFQPSYFFPAPAKDGRKPPLLVLFHTWSYNMFDMTEVFYGGLAECRARGWSLLCPNFRGPNNTPQGCGSDLATGDIRDAIEWVKKNHPVDEDRVYAMGGSGGGHMTLLLAGRFPELWAGCAAFCPPADLAAWHPASKKLQHGYWKHLEAACGGTPEEKPEEYRHRSPISYADVIRGKGVNVMLITGIHDGQPGKGSVPVSIVSHMFNALAEANDRISEETIRHMDGKEEVPAAELFAGKDPFYDDANRVLFRRASGNVQYTVFEGGHGGNENAAMWWLGRQRRGNPADWSLPGTAKSEYRDFTK